MNSNSMNNNQSFNNQNQANEYGYSQDDNVKESLMGVSTGKALDEDNNIDVNTGSSNTNNNQTNNDDSEESDLSRFFR